MENGLACNCSEETLAITAFQRKPLLCPPLRGKEMKYELPSEGRKYFSLSSQERVGVRFPLVETPSVSPPGSGRKKWKPPKSKRKMASL